MKRLVRACDPVWTVETILDILATLHENSHYDVEKLGELGGVVKQQNLQKAFGIGANALSISSENPPCRQRVA